MKQALFKLTIKTLSSLIERSIKDDNILAFVVVLITHLGNIIELLTDDDRDNTYQVRNYIKHNLESFINS